MSKRIFLAFCYGMSSEGIARLIAGNGDGKAKMPEYQRGVEELFHSFQGLKTYRTSMEDTLERQGNVSSMFGNARRRTSRGPLSAKERRWAINHSIQASATLIFKEALVGLSDEFGPDCMLLPVHDAILLQFPCNEKFEALVQQAQNIMVDAFKRRCPGVSCKVTAGSFAN